MATRVTAAQHAAEIAGLPYWESPLKKRPLPARDANGCFIFQDFPEFRPNVSPAEVIQAGAFGGGYFRSIHSSIAKKTYAPRVHEEFPSAWFKGLDVSKMVTSSRYDMAVNLYGVKCGNSLDHWEQSGWIKPQDPYGWFQWYCRFYLGRRTPDDSRQVARWVSAIGEKGRWRTYLVGQCVRQGRSWSDQAASPATRQTLLHWGYKMTKADFDRLAPAIRAGKSVIYMGPAVRSGTISDSSSAGREKKGSGLLKRPAAAEAMNAGAPTGKRMKTS